MKTISGDILLDQHFLMDGGVAQLLVDLAEVSEKDAVVEVGAGLGLITTCLARAAGMVYAVEKDGRLIPYLMRVVERYPNVRVIHGDFTQLPLPHFSKVVANPPFQLIEHMINRVLLLNQAPMTLILPAPFAQRIADPRSSLLSFKVSLAYRVEVVRFLESRVFNPPTRRRTAITLLRPKERKVVEDLLIDIFRQGDKKVRNALRQSLSQHLPRRVATKVVELSPLSEDVLNKRVCRINLRDAQKIGEVIHQDIYRRLIGH